MLPWFLVTSDNKTGNHRITCNFCSDYVAIECFCNVCQVYSL